MIRGTQIGKIHKPAAEALPLVWKGLVAMSGATAAATKGFVDGTATENKRDVCVSEPNLILFFGFESGTIYLTDHAHKHKIHINK